MNKFWNLGKKNSSKVYKPPKTKKGAMPTKVNIVKQVKPTTCCLCGKPLDDEYGSNARPIKSGRCCSTCNFLLVIPARMKKLEEANGPKG